MGQYIHMLQRILTFLSFAIAALMLAACGSGVSPANFPIPQETLDLMKSKGLKENSPIFVRIFKKESELEVWKRRDDGHYALLKTYPICKWSGGLGPKLKQGDKQAPEGFYTVNAHQMNPKSSYHLSFNLGYPNKLDKAYRRTGNFLMVHGDCRSAGCYAMTDVLIEEIYALAREAFVGGQTKFQVHAMPFRMTQRNMKKYAKGRWSKFWTDLKRGYDAFEMTAIPPKINVCERRYLVNAAFSSKNIRTGAHEICPPYRTFVPEIVETARGPKIVQAYAGTPDYERIIRNLAAHTSHTAGVPTSRHAVNGPLSTRQSVALRNSIRVSR
ncbi:MAG: murein L,D-transpeptidase [bacterium]|nr:murein L,D-transpeptidase [bacterium]